VTTIRRRPAGATATRPGCISHQLVSTSRRPPPAFYGVPPACGASNASNQVPACRELISVSRESIRLGMEVYDYDGVHVGWVKDVVDATFLVGRRWRGDLRVPLEQVLAVLDQGVVLTVPRAQVGMADSA
jgi:hypothetical protein